METVAVVSVEMPTSRFAEPDRFFEHRIEDRRKVAGRGIDDLQDLGGRGLLFERLIAFSGTLGKLPLEIGNGLLRIV
jgi:hypothetical protein